MLKSLRDALVVSLLIVGLVLAGFLVRFVRVATDVTAAVPVQVNAMEIHALSEINQTRGALVKEIDSSRGAVLKEVDKQATGLRRDATGQVSALRKDTMARIDTLTSDLDSRTGEALNIADKTASGTLAQVAGLRSDLKPSLDGAAALEKDALDSWDDSYWDVKASIESGTVAMNSLAQASGALAGSSSQIAENVAGITADVHKETTELTKPQTKMQQFRTWLLTVAKLYGAI